MGLRYQWIIFLNHGMMVSAMAWIVAARATREALHKEMNIVERRPDSMSTFSTFCVISDGTFAVPLTVDFKK